MRLALAVILVLALVPLAPSAPAAHAPCTPTTSAAVATIGPGRADTWTFYVTVDEPLKDVLIPLPWVYQETNGNDGLQRSDFVRDDTCGGDLVGDSRIF